MKISLPIPLAFATILLAGCSDDSPFQEAKFPSTPGNYVQFYKEGDPSPVLVKMAVVDSAGTANVVEGRVADHGKLDLSRKLVGVNVAFEDCGYIQFTEPQASAGKVFSNPIQPMRSCPIWPIPVQWQRVAAAN